MQKYFNYSDDYSYLAFCGLFLHLRVILIALW